MRIEHKPDAEKALEVLLYVARGAPNMYNALKVVYFADKRHLERYGRLIYGDSYLAMRLGPVPSLAYDLAKEARGDTTPLPAEQARLAQECLSVDATNMMAPRRQPNTDLLSESDIECLDEAIEQYGHMEFGELRDLSHNDPAFQSADENDLMSLQVIAECLAEADALLDYLQNG